MENKSNTNKNCNMYVMPSKITDADITALFNGVVGVVRKKIELETKSEMLNINLSFEKLLKELKEKQAECNRLKNEILFLRDQLQQQNNQNL